MAKLKFFLLSFLLASCSTNTREAYRVLKNAEKPADVTIESLLTKAAKEDDEALRILKGIP